MEDKTKKQEQQEQQEQQRKPDADHLHGVAIAERIARVFGGERLNRN